MWMRTCILRSLVLLIVCWTYMLLCRRKYYAKDTVIRPTAAESHIQGIVSGEWNANDPDWHKTGTYDDDQGIDSDLIKVIPMFHNISWYKNHVGNCQKVNRYRWEQLSNNMRTVVSQRIIVNDRYKLMYCPTPTVSVGPFMRLMYAIEWNMPVSQVSSKHINNKERFAYLSDYSLQEQVNMLKNYRKFMVTRHPLIRLLAVYKQKFASANAYFHERYGKEIVRKVRGTLSENIKGDDVTFKEFAKYIGYVYPQNEHWLTQYSLCLPCHVQYDMCLQHESINTASIELLSEFGLKHVVDAVPTDTWDYIDIKEAIAMYRTVPVQVIGKIVWNFRSDFEFFDYSSFNFYT